ncbi:hypothetical protein VTL71DRAFT_3846 [Oculimacula yallundae]
MSYIL